MSCCCQLGAGISTRFFGSETGKNDLLVNRNWTENRIRKKDLSVEQKPKKLEKKEKNQLTDKSIFLDSVSVSATQNQKIFDAKIWLGDKYSDTDIIITYFF